METIQLTCCRLSFCTLFLVGVAPSAHAALIRIYLFAGQSNMVGGANVVELPPSEATLASPQASLFQYRTSDGDTTAWGPMAPRTAGGANAYFGPELSFAQAMERRTGEPVAIIKVAYNGTGLAVHWLPELNDLYAQLTDKVTSALAQLEPLGYEPVLSGFVWVQGENDAGVLSRAEQYGANLETLAAAIRTDFGAMPFVYNQLHAAAARTYRAGPTVKRCRRRYVVGQRRRLDA